MGGGQLSSLRENLQKKKEEAALPLYSPEGGRSKDWARDLETLSLQRRDVLRRGIHQNMNGLRNNAAHQEINPCVFYLFPQTYLKLFGE